MALTGSLDFHLRSIACLRPLWHLAKNIVALLSPKDQAIYCSVIAALHFAAWIVPTRRAFAVQQGLLNQAADFSAANLGLNEAFLSHSPPNAWIPLAFHNCMLKLNRTAEGDPLDPQLDDSGRFVYQIVLFQAVADR